MDETDLRNWLDVTGRVELGNKTAAGVSTVLCAASLARNRGHILLIVCKRGCVSMLSRHNQKQAGWSRI